MDLSRFNDDQLAALWHQAHDAIEEMEKGLRETVPYLTAKSAIEEINKIATQRLHDSGASSIATPHGTIHTVSKTTARIMDPEEFRGFVIEQRAWDMLDWKANMTVCRAWMDENRTTVPGVELSTSSRLSITSPKKRINNAAE